MKKQKQGPAYSAPAVDRMLDIVEFLVEHNRPYGVAELSRTLEISNNSVFRIMRRLVDRGYVEVDADGGGYQLGLRFLSLGMRLSHRYDLRTRARPHLEALARDLEETVQIQVLDGEKLLVLDVVQPPVEYFVQVVPGSRADFHCSAMGKSILALLDSEAVCGLLPKRLQRFSENTITAIPILLQELKSVARTGIAYDREEHLRGIYCIASPVFDASGAVRAGVGITGLTGRADPLAQKESALRVRECARQISVDMGYSGEVFEGFHGV